MGLDIRGNLIVGVPVNLSSYFILSQEWNYTLDKGCDECESFHKKGKNFCAECGLKFKQVEASSPSEQMIALCEELGMDDPYLTEEDARRSDIFCDIAPHCSYESDGILAIGVQLGETASNRSFEKAIPVGADEQELEEAFESVKEYAKILGIEDKPQVYISIYYSY